MKIRFDKIINALTPYGILVLKRRYIITNIFNCFRNKFKNFHVRDNSVLVVEFYKNHGETLPGYIKYFLGLGYNIDVILNKPDRKERNDLGLFYCFRMNDKVRVKPLPTNDLNLFLRSAVAFKYKHILINTFNDGMERGHLLGVNLFKLKPVCVAHNPDINNDYFRSDKIISPVKIESISRKTPFIINPHFFGEYQKRDKSKKTTFVAFHSDSLKRRNINLLFEACDKLFEKGIIDFSVKIIRNKMKIPEKYLNNFQLFGTLDFQSMYNEIQDSDFFLALIDQASVTYTNKASGTYQLCYGFLKPIVLHKKFSDISGLNNENSILYSDNGDLADAMEKCINMSGADYLSLVSALETSEKELYDTSLNNLKKVLEI